MLRSKGEQVQFMSFFFMLAFHLLVDELIWPTHICCCCVCEFMRRKQTRRTAWWKSLGGHDTRSRRQSVWCGRHQGCFVCRCRYRFCDDDQSYQWMHYWKILLAMPRPWHKRVAIKDCCLESSADCCSCCCSGDDVHRGGDGGKKSSRCSHRHDFHYNPCNYFQ